MTLAVVLSACGTPTSGEPVPAAGFEPEPTTATSSTTARTKKLDGVEMCSLVKAEDLTTLGGLSTEPKPRPDVLPESCAFPLGGAADELALVGLFKPYDQVREQQPTGHAETAAGYRTWVRCAVADGYQTCTAAVAVRDDRTVVVGLTRRDSSERQVLGALQKLTETVLNRLPPG
jgi:hypothetical protein